MGEKLETQIFCGFCQCGEKYFLVFYHSDQNWEEKKKGGASKHFNNENIKETSTPDLCLPQDFRVQTQTLPVTPSLPFFGFGGWFYLLVVGFWFGFGFFLSCLLLSLRHRATPAGYKLWWARSATLRAQNPFLIWQEIIWIHHFFLQYMKAAEFTVTSSWSPSKYTAQSTASHA